jgi:hypothetical protein
VDELFLIERDTPRLADLDHADTLERMIQNTDDAYGFPPFRHLAPAITINGLGYQQLREKEREILAGFLSNVRTRVIASDKFGWADEIPALLNAENTRSGAPGVTRESRLVADGWPRWAPSPTGGLA